MAKALEVVPEQFRPIPIRFGSSLASTIGFHLRRMVDLQLATIWAFLEPRLPGLDGSLLDVGCGEMPYRSRLHPNVAYTGIDVPQAATFAMSGSDAITAFDGVRIPFADASFDTVLCTEVLEHAAEPQQLIAEIERVLKPRGTFIATVPFSARVHYAPYDFHRFTKFALARMLESFDDVSIGERGNDVAVIANKLIVVVLRMIPASRWAFVRWPLLVPLIPLTAIFVAFAHLTIALGVGSKDDPLGYAIIAIKAAD